MQTPGFMQGRACAPTLVYDKSSPGSGKNRKNVGPTITIFQIFLRLLGEIYLIKEGAFATTEN